MNVIEITPTIGITLDACMNAETACDGLDIADEDRNEVTLAAATAADKVLAEYLDGQVAEGESSFREWNGGACYQAPTKTRGLAVRWFQRRPLFVDECDHPSSLDECIAWSEWEHLPVEQVPGVIRLGVESLLYEAEDARQAVLAEAERMEQSYQAEAAATAGD